MAEPIAAGRRRRFRFSLRRLLIVLTVAVLVLSHGLSSYRLYQAEKELAILRREGGFLQIQDESQVQFVALPQVAENTYRWRVHVPQGANYVSRVAVNDLPPEGFPADGDGMEVRAGEQVLGFELVERADGECDIHLRCGVAHTLCLLAPDDEDWLNKGLLVIPDMRGRFETEAFDVGDKKLLLQMRVAPPGESPFNTTSARGLMFWLEPSE